MSTPKDLPPTQSQVVPPEQVPNRSLNRPIGTSFHDLSSNEQMNAKYERRLIGSDLLRYIAPQSISNMPVDQRTSSQIDPATLFIGRVGQPTSPNIRELLNSATTQREFFLKAAFDDSFIGDAFYRLGVFTIISSILSNPFERARALAQADFASYRSMQIYNPEIDESISRGVVANRLDYMSEFQKKFPNNNRPLMERPQPYEVYVRNAVESFETELLEHYKKNPVAAPKGNIPQQVITSLEDITYEQATKFRSLHLAKYSNVHLFHVTPTFLAQYQFAPEYIKPQSIGRKLFHTTYVEPSRDTIRKAMRSIIDYYSVIGPLRMQILPTLFKLLPIFCLFTFYLPWKSFLMISRREDPLANAQFQLARFHATYGVYPYFLFYPILAVIGRRSVHKGLLFPRIHRESPEFIAYLNQIRSYHENHESFKRYLVDTMPKETAVNKMVTHTEAVALSIAEDIEKSKLLSKDIKEKHKQLKEAKDEIKKAGDRVKKMKLSNDSIHDTGRTLLEKISDPKHRATLTSSQIKEQEKLAQQTSQKIAEPHAQTHDVKLWRELDEPKAKEPGRIEKTVDHLLKEQREQHKHKSKVILDRLVAKERARTFEQSIARYAARAEGGFKSYFRGMLPMSLGVFAYLFTFVPTYTILSSALIVKYHEIRSKALPGELEPNSFDDLSLEVSKAIIPFAASSLIASYAAYPLSTIRSYIMATNSPGYVSLISPPKSTPILQPLIYNQAELKMAPFKKVSTNEEFLIASREIYRQGGIRGFFRGASIIPLLRVPTAIAAGCILFDKLHTIWPTFHQIIDSQHFFIHQPTL